MPPIAFVRLEVDGGGTWRLEDPATSIPGSVLGDTGLDLFQPRPIPPSHAVISAGGSGTTTRMDIGVPARGLPTARPA